jgi:amidase
VSGSVSKHRVPFTVSYFAVHRDIQPQVEISPGDTVTLETEDAFGGQIARPGDRRDRGARPLSNGVSGPIYVRGAKPGDAVKVEVLSIRPRDGRCATYLWPYPYVTNALGDVHEHETRICPIENGTVRWSDRLTIPYAPMLRVIATCPPTGELSTEDVSVYGGNLDIREIGPGAEVRLPVGVEGALLVLGDCHAGQGDGEVGGAALEMAAEVDIRVGLEQQADLDAPRVITADEICAVASGLPMERSVATAYGRLARWVEADFGMRRHEAYLLLTQVGRISVGYFDLGVVAAKLSHRYLPPEPSG